MVVMVVVVVMMVVVIVVSIINGRRCFGLFVEQLQIDPRASVERLLGHLALARTLKVLFSFGELFL